MIKAALLAVTTALASPNALSAGDHVALAKSAAGAAYAPVQAHLCNLNTPEDKARLAVRRAAAVLKPTRVFDNFYYVGAEDVSAWALTDPKGIILFDSLHSPAEAQARIVEGLRSLGLNPRDIRYVVITHGHGDHFGGAQFLADTYAAQLVASDADWAWMQNPANLSARAYAKYIPRRGLSRNDGDVLTLGRLRVRFHETPGHTPGTLSSTFQVLDRGRPRTVAFWAGIGLRNDLGEAEQYVASLQRFRSIARAARAQIGITNHPHADMTLERVANLPPFPRVANPMVVGPASVDRWLHVVEECARAQVAKLSSPSDAGGGD